ncbi:hypothetical protein NADFUDRAFT_40100 [Nadsonia fulvescens var. elongata DSM 6958]|uniref:AD domain-containing protein n=1 Tax=Nadsonia fulvescens var. elongata DSM 6958 TaxID=857566 RepID=A0A1E3PNB1_9ASCO|nr:hypothetical protein NADFUDRAFT_40100 [Nadsonia fulvescens var. elongata DSM 6958]
MNVSLEWAIGLKVELTTILDTVITGVVYAYDPITSTVTVVEGNGEIDKPVNLRVIKPAFIRHVNVFGQSERKLTAAGSTSTRVGFEETAYPIGPISLTRLAEKESAVLKEEQKKQSTRGPTGVSTEGQEIFNIVHKTLPTRWYEQSIIVMDEVRIDPPYQLTNCLADNSASSALALVKKIVEGAWKKIETVDSKGG